MPELRRRNVLREGVIGGLVAGAAFAAAEVLLNALAGGQPGAPWQLSASLLLGDEALSGLLSATVFFVGALLHFGLSALFGVGFAALVWMAGRDRRNSYGFMLLAGAAYGVVIWVIDFQVIARLAFPWFLETSAVIQLVLHALAFGVPLGFWVALRVRDVEVPGVHEFRHDWQTPDGDEEVVRTARDLDLQRDAREDRDTRPPA